MEPAYDTVIAAAIADVEAMGLSTGTPQGKQALIEAIASELPDCDLKLAELLEGEPDVIRIAIIDKLREMLKERAMPEMISVLRSAPS